MFDGDDLLRPKLRDLKEALPSLFDTLEPLARAHVRYKDIGDLVERIDLMLERMEVIAELLRPLRRIAVATRETIEAAI